MDADDAPGSSRRMDLNLYLGLPRAPRSRRSDLGSDLALSTPMPSSPSSSAASVDAPPPPEAPHAPYSPSRADLSPTPPEVYSSHHLEDLERLLHEPLPAPGLDELPDDIGFGFLPPPPTGFLPPPPLIRPSEFLGWEDRPSSSTASSSFLPDAAARYRSLLEQTGRRWIHSRPTGRFRSDLPPLSSEARPLGHDAAVPVPVPHHEPTIDAVGDSKVTGNGAEVGASEESEERGKSVAAFECNICFEIAGEPVVTSCGHLFCWPCLYQWLNVYSNHKECPVCKGEVTEANVTPIYGRGNSSSDAEKAVEEGKQPGLTIPPRPHGNRLESFRQQFQHLRPMSRRLGDAHGILSSWRRLVDQQIMSSVPESAVHEIGDIAQHTGRLSRLATRMRARRLLSEVDNPADGGFIAPDTGFPGNSAPDAPRLGSNQGFDLLQRLTLIGLANTERLATAVSGLRRIAVPGQYGASASSSNPLNPEATVDGTHVGAAPSTDQASNSSTIAVIQGDAGVPETAGEPSNAGSSRSLRRRGRSNALASLDADGGPPQRNKRRRT